MKTIPSFQIDHNILKRGIYISRIDDDITTYDIRMREPNKEPVMTNAAMHTIEHLFATYVRNTEFGDNIIYFGPMGCRTGFYFLTRSLSIPKELVWRQPFPGPGLGVRIIGEITADKIKVLQDADWVLRDEMAKNGYEKNLAQFFCVLPCVKTVGVMGDHRTYDHLVAIRAVTTDDFMTADWAKIPYDILAKVSNRITNEVDHVNRVVYDITSKPPGTVEWE